MRKIHLDITKCAYLVQITLNILQKLQAIIVISLLSVIVRVSIVLKRTVVDNDLTFRQPGGSHLQSYVNCGSSVDGIYKSDCCCHWSV